MKTVRFDVVSALFDDKGDETSVALTADDLVVEVHQSQFHDELYYTLGKLDVGVPQALHSADIGGGKRPCVAASPSGTSLAVVEVHERSLSGTLGYRVGLIQGNEVLWKKDTEYDRGGFRPSIALEGLRAVAVHQVLDERVSDLYYKVGTVDPETGTISNFIPATKFGRGFGPHVAFANGYVVVVYLVDETSYNLEYVVGRVEGNSITFGKSRVFATAGLTAAVAMTSDGFVVMLYGDTSTENPRNFTRTAFLDAQNLALRLSDDIYVVNTASELVSDQSPLFVNTFAVAMNDRIAIETVSDANAFLGSSSSFLLDRATWMAGNFEALGRRSLHDITIPGSHDASTYEIIDCSKVGHDCNSRTQRNNYYEQLRSGIRYFDVRPLYYKGVLTTGHIDDSFRGCNSAPLQDILEDVARFIAGAPREIVILKFSHLRDRDTETLDFTRSQKSALVNMVRDKLKDHFYTGALSSRLAFTPISRLFANREKGIVLPVFDQFRNDKDLLGNGLYSYDEAKDSGGDRSADLAVFDDFAEDNSVNSVYSDQLEKFLANRNAELFLFSATLTQSIDQAVLCQVGRANPIVALAAEGNAALARKFTGYYADATFNHDARPNILFVDLASDFATDVSLFLNRRRYLGDQLYSVNRDYVIPGDSVYSENGKLRMLYQKGGNLVLLDSAGKVLKSSHTDGKGSWRAIMQEDGNFVAYRAPNVAVFQTYTSGNPGALLKVQNDEKVAIYSKDGLYLKTVLT
jgi:hypothetical protein